MAGKTFRNFWQDRRGNYVIATVITMIPLCGAIGLGVDFAEMSRQRQVTLNALDAAGIATARRLAGGATDAQAKDYAKEFFEANVGSIGTSVTTLNVTLPNSNTGGGTLKLGATLKYKPYFMAAFRAMIGAGSGDGTIPFNAQTEIRLKNTLEVALVLDNSGSMSQAGKGSSMSRMDLLKDAAGQLVTLLVNDAKQMKQVAKPVQISLVPFAGSVNVGSGNDEEPWMDTTGISPIHHENFDWSTMSLARDVNQYAEQVGNAWYARGLLWGDQKDKPLTRFSLNGLMQRVASKVAKTKQVCSLSWNGFCFNWVTQTTFEYTYDKLAPWSGCVEARPSPYNVNDAAPTTGTPATLFVPMFAPDETDAASGGKPANNNWLLDVSTASTTTTAGNQARQRAMPKYFTVGDVVSPVYASNQGPNLGCETAPITPLTDATVTAGRTAIDEAIEAMSPGGATNVPEGMAWGWRTVSNNAPFTQGRPETERGNDKVVIVLTDGENTYYTPDTVRAQSYSGSGYASGGNDLAANASIYSALGYAKLSNGTAGRIFGGTSKVDKGVFTNANYTKAMNEQFATLCGNAKAAGVTVMTVALDLNANDTTEAAQIAALKECASDSKYTKDEDDPSKAAKLFWNSTGSSLAEHFKEIARELSNLRIVG